MTKTGLAYDGDKLITGTDSRYERVIARTEGCLRRLGTDVIDLMLIHWPDYGTPFDEPMRALEQLKAAGKIRHGGVSNFSVELLEYCRQHGEIAANQVGYHLFNQRMQRAVLPYCLQHNIGFMAYGTLGFGLLTGVFTPDHTFEDGDRRRRGGAFGLPLFQQE